MQHQLYLGAGRVTATFCRRLAPFAAVLAVTVLAAPMHAQILPSDGHETIEESHVLLDAVPIRPLIVTPAGDRVWAVNVQGNCVQEFVAAGAPSRTFDVPWNPISIAWYHSTDPTYPGEKLLVVCRGTYALVSVDLTTGKVDRMLRLPAQPADLIVDATPGAQRAFVSCQADDEVVDVDLGGRMSIVRRFEIPGKTPTSLFFDANGDVMVAPLHSGNNSGVHKAPGTALQPLELGILDFDDPAIAAVSGGFRGLPDQDLFRCVRSAIPPAAPVTSVARSLGTLLYSAALNATTNSWWVLHTDAKNKDPNKQTEADIRGEFATNRLVIVDRTTGAKTFVSLDSHAIGHPDGIAMAPGGWAFLVGTQTDNVALLDPTGTVQFVWNVPDGSIPRQVVWNTALNSFFVHCWGRNTVEAYSLGSPPLHWGTFDLGLDPTSDARKAGRKLFYDGANSLHGNLSCETCHAYGEMDFLAWNLSHGAAEEKGPLVTQTLRGIDGTMPFHWRGEQQKGSRTSIPRSPGCWAVRSCHRPG